MDRYRYDEEQQALMRWRVVATADAILRGELGIIEGARQLSSLAHDLVIDWTTDPDFLVFGALDTETDHLPVGAVRAFWDPAAVTEKDATVERIEAAARAEVEQACRSVVSRFRDA
jgi:hypothetical protein